MREREREGERERPRSLAGGSFNGLVTKKSYTHMRALLLSLSIHIAS